VVALTLTVTVPSTMPRYLYERLVDGLYYFTKLMRREYGIKVLLKVNEVSESFPVAQTFHSFHNMALGNDIPVHFKIEYEEEESSDVVREAAAQLLELINEHMGAFASGMSRVGVADAA